MNAQKLNEIAKMINKEIPGMGFSLIVFDFGETMREFRYISNAERSDMIEALEGVLNKWKNENHKTIKCYQYHSLNKIRFTQNQKIGRKTNARTYVHGKEM